MLELGAPAIESLEATRGVELRALEAGDWDAVTDIYWDGIRDGLWRDTVLLERRSPAIT